MKNSLVLVLIIFQIIQINLITAQTLPANYSRHKYDYLEYGLFVPSPYDSTKKYPLITYFHGRNDTTSYYLNWYSNSVQSVNPCFVITPKNPPNPDKDWGCSWYCCIEPYMETTLKVIDNLIKEYSIDTNRLYVYGGSMGGYGTFDVLYRRPGRFAAAMALCGGGNPASAPQLSKTPLWILHGSADDVVPIWQSRDIYNQMIASGYKRVRYTEYPGAGHLIGDYAANELTWPDWIFNFSKTDTFNEKPDIPINLTCKLGRDNKSYELKWNDANNRKDRKNKVWYYKVIRNNLVITSINYSTTFYIDKTPIKEFRNTYNVVAVNYDFIESDTSNSVSVILPKDSTQVDLYLCQTPPGKTPVIFANGIVSKANVNGRLVMSPDGNAVYWSAVSYLPSYSLKIYYMQYENGKWGQPQVPAFAKNGFTYRPLFSPDGSKLYYDYKDSLDSEWTTKYVEKTGAGWGEPKNDGFLFNTYSSFTLSGKIFYPDIMEGKQPSGIFSAIYSDTGLSDIQALPSVINSSYVDYSPYISSDESYLLFSSNRPYTDGYLFLYVSFRKNNGTWTTPQKLFSNIRANSPSVSSDGKYIFFNGNNSDIYWVDAKVIESFRPVGIKNIEYNKSGFSVFPNPSKDRLTISFGKMPVKAVSVEIFNTTGLLLFSRTYQNVSNETIDLTCFSRGMYIIKITNEQHSCSWNVVKE
jgi:hypothetical protein